MFVSSWTNSEAIMCYDPTAEQRKAIINCIIENKFCFSGVDHQNEFKPVFDDGTIFMVNQKVWGGYMAEAWNKVKKTDDFGFRDFSWNIPFCIVPKKPEFKEI
jgi:hypothetical protein